MAVIGLDARMVGPTPSGLGTYAIGLARALVARDRENRYVVIRRPDAPGPIVPDARAADVVVAGPLDAPGNLLQGGTISRLGLDLYHSLHHFLPLRLRVPRVVLTVHDLIWIEHRGLIVDRYGAVERLATHWYARAAMGYAVHRADRLIAVSAYTRDRVAAYYRLDPESIAVVHHGVDGGIAAARAVPSGASRPYFLVLGNTRPYKNVPTALEAFAICARGNRAVDLVIAGRGDSARRLGALARRLGIADRVRFAGPVSDADRLRLFHGATALVFPSIVEGFGLPVLEAMAAGCPVIASNSGAVAEVAGDAARLCDPRDAGAFAAAMTTLLDAPVAAGELCSRGLARARQFSWDRSADQTLAVYRVLLERRASK